MTDVQTTRYVEMEVREDHTPPCAGDPQTAPTVGRFRVADDESIQAHVEQRIDFGVGSPDSASDELLRGGLAGMGFRAAEAQNAFGILAQRHANDDAPLSKEALLVDALCILT